jgi:predicted transcriptional regulator
MAKYLTDKGREFRKMVVVYDGHQATIADVLGVSVAAVSTRLNSELHGAWWRSFKRKRSKRRQAERQRRWRERAQERMMREYRGGS